LNHDGSTVAVSDGLRKSKSNVRPGANRAHPNRTLVFSDFYADTSDRDFAHRLSDRLERGGLATFETARDSRAELVALSRSVGRVFMHRDSEADGITKVVVRASDPKTSALNADGRLGLTSSGLNLHTDASGVTAPPDVIFLFCRRSAGKGGLPLLADARAVYTDLCENAPDLAKQLAEPATATFRNPDGSTVVGSIFEPLPRRRMAVRFRSDLMGHYSAPVAQKFDTLLQTIERHTVVLPLKDGQGYAINNGWWLHGRTAFKGTREMYRLLVKTGGRLARGFRHA
jgi:Taurine catabolism dioxygenase TauD, TfdA family